jgi:transcriptional regulator with XRE-family HTH domain
MALFFDGNWFDERLAGLGLSRATLAAALGLSESELAEVWKDQRELSARNVAVIAALLGVSAQDVTLHAGISTPVPSAGGESVLAEIAERLSRIETALAELTTLVRAHL